MKHTSTGRTQKFFTLLFSIVLIGSPMVAQSALAADYPPSIETLEVGQPMITPVAPRVEGQTVVVPKATSTDIPLIIGEPVSIKTLANKVLNNKSVQQSPVKLSPSLTIGGIGADEKAPTATISASKKSEIQVPTDVPTRVTVSGLKASSSGKAYFVDSSGKSISLGSIKVDANGKVYIPALTFSKGGVSYKISLVINGKTTTFTIRSSN
jgi:hypothetical protein